MKKAFWTKAAVAVCLVALLAGHSAMADDKPGKPKKPGKETKELKPVPPAEKPKESWVDVKISTPEREAITTYVRSYDEPKSGKKPKDLPPGLQKKVARGGKLPPGWEKKLSPGQIMPVEVFQECHPLPPELVVKLPTPPKGVITVTISGKVVRLIEATREILDVFEVGP